jgi:hypothetical protein
MRGTIGGRCRTREQGSHSGTRRAGHDQDAPPHFRASGFRPAEVADSTMPVDMAVSRRPPRPAAPTRPGDPAADQLPADRPDRVVMVDVDQGEGTRTGTSAPG